MSDLPANTQQAAPDRPARRRVRSYVLRGGRLTDGQKRALDDLWPRYGVGDGEAPLDLPTLFGNARPVILEIGFGNGDATWRMAEAYPQQNFIGVEVHRPGIGRLLLELDRRGLANVRVAEGDAVEFLRQRIPPGSLAGVRIYFPDPWPKKRHHKRRLVQPGFVDLLASRLGHGGVLHLATDWAPYAEHMLEVLRAAPGFRNLADGGAYRERPEWRPLTKYERRGQGLGHGVYDLVFERVPQAGRG